MSGDDSRYRPRDAGRAPMTFRPQKVATTGTSRQDAPRSLGQRDRMNAAYDDSADELSAEDRGSNRLRFELIFASLGLAFGLFLLPALIYWVGAALLGAYGEKAGLSTFYVDFYGDLADGAGRTWILALGPLVLVYLLRAVFIGVRSKKVETTDSDEPPYEPPRRSAPPPRREAPPVRKERSSSARPARVEPRMGSD
jgi:hypothetical protein